MTVFLRPVQVWAPPTPPRDDSDVYMDSVDDLLYEETPMTEAQLPPVFVKKEPRRIKTEPGVSLREYTVPLPWTCCLLQVSSAMELCPQVFHLSNRDG